MKVEETKLSGVRVIEPRVHEDARGFFVELYNEARYRDAGIDVTFVQDNLSRSARGTLRGLHMQRAPHAQDKLVWAVEGEVLDVVADVDPASEHFGHWVSINLDRTSKRQVFVPAGYAHGFCVLSETAVVQYKCSALYAPDSESGVRWDDPELGIPWPIEAPIVSDKDRCLPLLHDLKGNVR